MRNPDNQPVIVRSDGSAYGPPSSAKAWGERGCPVLPRCFRNRYATTEVPSDLSRLFGGRLCYGQLDSEIISQYNLNRLPNHARSVVRNVVNGLTYLPQGETAIPAEVPLAWLIEIPIRGRTRNAIGRIFISQGERVKLRSAVLVSEFLKVRSVGIMTLIDLLCVMESAEMPMPNNLVQKDAERRAKEIDSEAFAWDLERMYQSRMASLSPIVVKMSKFASWAQAETDATTFGEGVLEVLSGSDAHKDWSSFVKIPLAHLSPQPPHPYVLIETWTNELSEVEREVFEHRLGSKNKQTLESLATRFDLTRERIRQIESKAKRKFQAFLSSDDAEPIRWRAETVSDRIGVAAPSRVIESLVSAPPHANDYANALLEFAGPYDTDGDWLISIKFQSIDVRSKILSHADEFGRLDRGIVVRELTNAGLNPLFHNEWLAREPVIREFNGALVVWGRSAKDRLMFALADLDRAATVDELLGHLQDNTSRGYALNALAVDDRVVRADRSRYALKSWGTNEYKGIAETIRQLIVEASQPVNIDDACVLIAQRYRVSEGSVRWYMEAPMFVIEGACVRLRSSGEPHRPDYKPVRETPGVFALGPQRVAIVLTVDTDMLRGSGRMLPNAAGGVLGIAVDDEVALTSEKGDTITLTYPETSIVGPSLGSMRVFAERLSADLGDQLTLIMDRSSDSVEARLTRSDATADGWEYIAHLTGIGADSGIDGLAESLHCGRGEIRAILRQRGDDVVLSALPQRPTSPRLADALGELRSQLRRNSGN